MGEFGFQECVPAPRNVGSCILKSQCSEQYIFIEQLEEAVWMRTSQAGGVQIEV